MDEERAPIVLMTDFGTRDHYVGVMKGVIAGIAPGVTVVDLTHEVRPQDLNHAAHLLSVSAGYFPAGSIFCVVVDPTVGAERRAIAVRIGSRTFVCPDNGLLTPLLQDEGALQAVSLTERAYHLPDRSATFHGRDLFAPVAAHLATGVPLEALGPVVAPETLVRLPARPAERRGNHWRGQVVDVDRFGNLITSLTRTMLGPGERWQVIIGSEPPLSLGPIRRTFADVAAGEPLAYYGSSGHLEGAIRNGDAARAWNAAAGTPVTVLPRTTPGRESSDPGPSREDEHVGS